MSSREIAFSAAGASGPANYIESCFSTYLYTGNGSTQTINNGIDLAGKGGLVWIKGRNDTNDHTLYDTVRGTGSFLSTNVTSAQQAASTGVTAFNATGFNLGTFSYVNGSGSNYASWTFREQPKFFDVVTYTGNGSASRSIPHNLGSVPGMMIVKCTSSATPNGDAANWIVYHRGMEIPGVGSEYFYMNLNTTAASVVGPSTWGATLPTDTNFTVGSSSRVNWSGETYVAYLFAHNAGGFGESGTDNVISCGSYTGNGSLTGPEINLGYEPQYVMIKNTTDATGWLIFDVMRGMPVGSATDYYLFANTSDAEAGTQAYIDPTATGFKIVAGSGFINNSGSKYIYMAIRRPMKPPTSGTEVFNSVARTGTGANATVTSGFVTDTVIEGNRTSSTAGTKFGTWNRLRGVNYLNTNTQLAEISGATTIIQANPWDVMDGYKVGTTSTLTNASSNTFINWMFKRAPGFHDVVCYTGTGAATTVAHNLGVVPELVIIKSRSSTVNVDNWWLVYYNFTNTQFDSAILQRTDAGGTYTYNTTDGFSSKPTATTLPLMSIYSNTVSQTYVAYLFASVAGVSKVGNYTGNGSSQTINCGFTGGARFVMIKRTDSTGDWYVWDTARGMVSGTDPSLLLNTTAAEVNANSVYTATTGFQIVSTAAGINASGGSYIFLAIA